MTVRKFIVTKAHLPSFDDPLIVAKGAVLSYQRLKTDWPGWLYCTDQNGNIGWVPEAWVQVDEQSCIMQRDYNATELSVSPGDLFHGKIIESGWVRGVDAQGDEGWVPLECLGQLED
jgi:hypothetical protein